MRARAAALLGAVAGRGSCDLPREVTDDFPLQNLADLLGVPSADRSLLLEWTNRVIGYQDPEHAHVVTDSDGRPVNPRSPAQLADMFGYAEEHEMIARAWPLAWEPLGSGCGFRGAAHALVAQLDRARAF